MVTPIKNVLIVDDQVQICLLIGEQLANLGFDCHSVTDPREALNLLAHDNFDLLISDVAMPGTSGLDLLTFVHKHNPSCKVILTTGHSNRRFMAQALMLGACDYIEKPFTTQAISEAVLEAMNTDLLPNLPLKAAAAMEEVSRRNSSRFVPQVGKGATEAALDSVRALARAVEARDPYTRRHSDHVTHYATHLAILLGASEAQLKMIRVAALLHDVGKIGIPDSILTKPGPLTDDEYELVKRHPALGSEILSNITLFADEALVVRHHHESWDGSGYPSNLVAEEIPWGARIINVADSMDAMLMKRVYKYPYTIDRMLDELRICAGRQFDPTIAAAALSWCCDNIDKLILPDRPIEALVYSGCLSQST